MFSNVVRAKEIVTVLARYGFGDALSQLGIPKNWLNSLVPEEVLRMNVWQRIRVIFESLGPTFVKCGQILSTRPDLLPEPLLKEFKQLRNQVTPLPWEEMEKIILAELKGSLEEHFDTFDKSAFACGSVGQVYRATLKSNGDEVALKIQKPGIKKAIRADLEIMSWLIKQAHAKFEDIQAFDLPGLVEETSSGILQELDFTIEARNATLFNSMNPDPEHVFAPTVLDSFTTEKLYVCAWVEGVAPTSNHTFTPDDAQALAIQGSHSVFHQIVINGFFHADPHSGNILITPDKRICFIDWGLTGLLTREMRYFLADLFSAIASMEAEKVVRTVHSMAINKTRLDRTKLEKEITFILRKYQALFLQNGAIGNILFDLLHVFGANGIHLAKDYALLAKAIFSIEETGLSLDPAFDIRTTAEPYLKKLTYERWNPGNVIQSAYGSLQSQFSRILELPTDVQRFFHRLEDADIEFKMKHEGLDKVSTSINAGVNRLVLGIIIASLLVGSSLIIASTFHFQPDLFALPTLLGTLGYLLAFVLSLRLAYDILWHGRHR